MKPEFFFGYLFEVQVFNRVFVMIQYDLSEPGRSKHRTVCLRIVVWRILEDSDKKQVPPTC